MTLSAPRCAASPPTTIEDAFCRFFCTQTGLDKLAALLADEANGERIAVTGNPTHTGSPRLFFVSLQRSDGSTLLRPAFERLTELEQDRRLRIEQRDQRNQQ